MMDYYDKTELAYEALNEAVLHIQNSLGVTTGDLAGLFFAGAAERDICAIFKSYIEAELRNK